MFIGGTVIPSSAYQKSPVWIPSDSPPPSGGYAFISNISAAGLSTFTTDPIGTTGADLIVACVTSYTGDSDPVVSDNKGNSWNELSITSLGNVRHVIWWSRPTTVGSGHTFTVTGSFPIGAGCFAAFSGSSASPVDQENGGSESAGTFVEPGAISPTEDNELIICGMSQEAAISDLSITGYTITDNEPWVSGNNFGAAMAYKIQTVAGLESPTWTWTNGMNSISRISSFKAA